MTKNHRIQPASLLSDIPQARKEYPSIYDLLYQFEDRFKHIEPLIESFIPESNRFDRIRSQAKQLESQFPKPSNRPPLFGALVGVKDIFHADGFVTQAGTQLPSKLFQGKQASIVTKLQDAGALIAGKTVTTEFAYFEPGPTRNPHNLNHTPGGSSSGSAAAVASGLVHIAIGTQTVGSVIRPAAYCGVVGYKPSYGRIDAEGVIYFSPSADHVGLFTQDVPSMQLVAEIVVEDWSNDQLPSDRPTLAIPQGAYLQQSTALDPFADQVQLLEDAGYTIKMIDIFDDIEEIDAYHQDMIARELAIGHQKWFDSYASLYRPRTAELIRKGQTISDDRMEAGREHRFSLRDRIEQIMDDNGIDLWICPSAPDVAPEGIAVTGSPAMNMPWTHAGVPSISVPEGFGKGQLPLGMQLCARFGRDEELIHWAQGIEAVLK